MDKHLATKKVPITPWMVHASVLGKEIREEAERQENEERLPASARMPDDNR